jgi:hypothetical protein
MLAIYKKANSQNFRINRTIKKMYNQNRYGLFFYFRYIFLILHFKVILHQFWMKTIFPSKFNLEYGGTFTKLFMHVSSRNRKVLWGFYHWIPEEKCIALLCNYYRFQHKTRGLCLSPFILFWGRHWQEAHSIIWP